jgi:predicted Zn-dependent protease
MIKKALPALLCLLTACATSPTGRTQFIAVSDSEIEQMGIQSFDGMKKQKNISSSSQYQQMAQCVAGAIVQVVGGNWEVVVFEDSTANAFALPGKKIGINSGMFKLAENQDQLAAVISHEIAHVMAKHSNERMSQEIAVNQGINAVQAFSNPQTQLGQTAMGLLGIGADYGLLKPFSRTQESEADIIGENLMAKAGFDPRQSIGLWQRMEKSSQGQQPPEFLSTHPAHDTRIAELQKNMPEAMSLFQKAQDSGKKPQCF